MDPKALVLYGQGINCDNETKRAFEQAGAKAEKVLMSQLISGEKNMDDYNIFVSPGGFSYGDDIAAGRVMAILFKYKLGEQTKKFVDDGKLVMGICNGFQVLVKMGLLPGLDSENKAQSAPLLTNDSGMFEDRWVYLELDPGSPCIFTKGIEKLYLPVRHMEGKLHTEDRALTRMMEKKLIVAKYTGPRGECPPGYPLNPNGSLDSIAGICDLSGRVFGLMPHPECCTEIHHHPTWTRDRGKPEYALKEYAVKQSKKIFENAVKYVRSNL